MFQDKLLRNGSQVYPDISNLIQISNLFNVTVDYLGRDQECMISFEDEEDNDLNKLIDFRLPSEGG
jgi:hypothetical protein